MSGPIVALVVALEYDDPVVRSSRGPVEYRTIWLVIGLPPVDVGAVHVKAGVMAGLDDDWAEVPALFAAATPT